MCHIRSDIHLDFKKSEEKTEELKQKENIYVHSVLTDRKVCLD